MRWLFFLIFKGCFLFLFADTGDDYTSIEPPYITLGDQRLSEADKAWASFQDEVEWFLQYRKPFELDFDKEDEKSAAKEIQKETMQQYQTLSETLREVQNDFIKFRTKMAGCALLNMGNSPDGYLNYTLSISTVTHWYIDYMEKNIFPHDWKEHYKEYLKEKTSKSNLEKKGHQS